MFEVKFYRNASDADHDDPSARYINVLAWHQPGGGDYLVLELPEFTILRKLTEDIIMVYKIPEPPQEDLK